jgi:hypothetical protein
VPFDDDACPNCGARFLDAALPGAEQTLLDKLPQGPRKPTNAFLVMVVGSVVVMAIIVGLLALLGTIL